MSKQQVQKEPDKKKEDTPRTNAAKFSSYKTKEMILKMRGN